MLGHSLVYESFIQILPNDQATQLYMYALIKAILHHLILRYHQECNNQDGIYT